MAAQIDDVDEDLSSTYTKKGASVSVTLTKVDSATIPAGPYYDDYNSESYIMKGYTSDYTEDTVLAVAFKYDGSNWVNQVLNSYVAEKDHQRRFRLYQGIISRLTAPSTPMPRKWMVRMLILRTIPTMSMTSMSARMAMPLRSLALAWPI